MLTGILILACWVFLGVYWNISASSVKPTAEGQDWSGRLARMPIWLGYILLLAIWGVSVWNGGDTTDGRFWCPYGHAERWAVSGAEMSKLKQGHKLVERGPYALVRHPIYTGHLLMGLGHWLWPAGCVRGASAVLRGLPDQAEAGGEASAAELSGGIPCLPGACPGAGSVRVVKQSREVSGMVLAQRGSECASGIP